MTAIELCSNYSGTDYDNNENKYVCLIFIVDVINYLTISKWLEM